MKNAIIFSGTGGQGIMSMGIMLANAAVESGLHATYMPSYGPEQRGGKAKCVVIIDKEEILSSMSGRGGLLVALTREAYGAFINELEPGGTLLYDNTVISPDEITRGDIRAVPVPAGDLAIELGSPKVANVIVLGVLAGIGCNVAPEQLQASLDAKFADKPQKLRDLNTAALKKGIELAGQYK